MCGTSTKAGSRKVLERRLIRACGPQMSGFCCLRVEPTASGLELVGAAVFSRETLFTSVHLAQARRSLLHPLGGSLSCRGFVAKRPVRNCCDGTQFREETPELLAEATEHGQVEDCKESTQAG